MEITEEEFMFDGTDQADNDVLMEGVDDFDKGKVYH